MVIMDNELKNSAISYKFYIVNISMLLNIAEISFP